MRLFIVAALLAAVSSAPAYNNNGVSPAMRTVLMDMLKNMMNNQGGSNFKVGVKPRFPAPPPKPFLPAPPAPFMPPPPPRRFRNNNNGLLMDMPAAGRTGFMGPPMMAAYCPPGPTSSDTCKDQKLFQALYRPDGSPRYNWVPPRNPWDSSVPDSVKDTAQNILIMKVNQRANRTPTPKEWELMTLLGDPKDGVRNPFNMANRG